MRWRAVVAAGAAVTVIGGASAAGRPMNTKSPVASPSARASTGPTKRCYRVGGGIRNGEPPTDAAQYGPCQIPGAYERGITLVSSGLHGYSMSIDLKHPGLTGNDLSLVASCATCRVGSAKGRSGVGSRKIKCSDLKPGTFPYDVQCKPSRQMLPSDFPRLPQAGDPMRDQDATVVGHVISVEPSASHDCVPNPQPTTTCVEVVTQQEIMEDAIYRMPIVARASRRARIVRVHEHHQGYRFDGKPFTRWVRKAVGNPAVYRATVSNRDPKAVFENVTLFVEVSLRR